MNKVSSRSQSGRDASLFSISVLAFAICFVMLAPVQAQNNLVKIRTPIASTIPTVSTKPKLNLIPIRGAQP